MFTGKRRLEKAQQAGEEAVRKAREYQDSYVPDKLSINLIIDEVNDQVRWLLWDADPDYGSPLVEGVLVPYALGTVQADKISLDAAMRLATQRAHEAVAQFAAKVGRLPGKPMYLIEVPLNVVEITQGDTPS